MYALFIEATRSTAMLAQYIHKRLNRLERLHRPPRTHQCHRLWRSAAMTANTINKRSLNLLRRVENLLQSIELQFILRRLNDI